MAMFPEREYRGGVSLGPIDDYGMVHISGNGTYPASADRCRLPVSDFERLAKAGMKIEFKDIADQVCPDRVSPQREFPWIDAHAIVKPIMERWQRANTVQNDRNLMMEPGALAPPFFLSGYRVGGTVHVFVAHTGAEVEPVILKDDAKLFPSDKLMAELNLFIESHKGKP